MRLVRRTFQVESIGVAVDNFEHGHVLGHQLLGVALLLETTHIVVAVEGEVVARAHNHRLVRCLEGFLGQMSALVVEQTVTVTAPSDSFHKDAI